MKTIFFSTLALVLASLSTAVSAGCMQGIPCISEMNGTVGDNTPKAFSTIQLGGAVNAGGSNSATVWSDRPIEASGYTLSETATLIDNSISLTADDAQNCTNCGDNRIQQSIRAMDSQSVGIQGRFNNVQAGNGQPLIIGGQSSVNSNVGGEAWAKRFQNE